MTQMMDRVLGVDLGGTKISAMVPGTGDSPRWYRRVATPTDDYEQTVHAVVALIEDAEKATGIRLGVGIGTPGNRSPESGLMKNCNSVCLNGMPLKQDLETAAGRPVVMANDADCFALSEARGGAGDGYATVFGVILGTGVGGGLVIDGKLHAGPNGIAGEWGHNALPWTHVDEWPGPACYCGQRGCIETWLNGAGLCFEYREVFGGSKSAKEIGALAAAGDGAASAVMEVYCQRLARALASVINIMDPEVIVLGGGLSKIGFLYRRVPEILEKYVFSDSVKTRLLAPVFGDDSGVRGAAILACQQQSDS